MARLRRVPAVRTLVLVRDPTERVESSYLKEFWSCSTTKEVRVVPALLDCINNTCDLTCGVLVGRTSFSSADPYWLMSASVKRAREFFSPEQVFIADSSFLRRGRSFYNHVAQFLGVKDFPADMTFVVANPSEVSVG